MTDETDPSRVEALRSALARVQERIAVACRDAGRDRSSVHLIVVTKYFPAADVCRLADLGVTDIGENRDQEAAAKMADLPEQVRRRLTVHFIGQLQSNKARHVPTYADVVQSVDRSKIAGALDRAAGEHDRRLEVLMQVDLSGAQGRGGVSVDAAPQLADAIAELSHLRLRGVMAVAPLGEDPAAHFERLATLAHDIRAQHPEAGWISAGMSGDLEAAIHAGATHLRVGSAILGSRPAAR
ncbi:YggS family pyridoxal phosphate-dependent enzyme [Rudaeicoccus suwonensis]|uniref:Pyridoxal phosphate homeostasis protein n=1 Tax=Rudaeicoccus suwonensis TaxID=657409 RepID=A0A561EC93_9MICO|nr:YggS family pyridoxal phosphate-dependent enzyme [Rudaeicoccus suwonensis]TWE13235.1 hypothetical protein BKA23_2064 [Rudaeicoccus suwonensis]